MSDNARTCLKCGAPVIVRIRREMKIRLIMTALAIAFAVIAGYAVWLIMHNLLQTTLVPLQHQ